MYGLVWRGEWEEERKFCGSTYCGMKKRLDSLKPAGRSYESNASQCSSFVIAPMYKKPFVYFLWSVQAGRASWPWMNGTGDVI